MNIENEFSYDTFEKDALLKLKQGVSLEGKDGVLAPLLKRLLEASLEGELDCHLREEKTENPSLKNRRNGRTKKTVKTHYGTVDIETPRDRDGSFEPEILLKRQTTLGDGLDHKIIGLYGLGMSYSDICDHLSEMYQLNLSPASITAITDKILPEIEQWKTRPLESVYPILWLDAIHYKVREDNAIKTKAVYCLIGVSREGIKELLGLYIGENESARFWLSVLNDIRHRGVEDILIASIDNLKGLAQAIEAVFPKTTIQLCIVHQIRNSLKYVPRKDSKAVVASMKEIYQAIDLKQAERALYQLELHWGTIYPSMVKSWINNWERLSQMFQFPDQIRKMMYTTNIIESFNSQLRKVTKSKRVFSNDQSLMKLLYLVQQRIYKNMGTMLYWKYIMAQFIIIFDDRFKVQ
jgi:putative transposase